MPRLSAIHRHPVKAFGTEAMPRATLRAGETLPGDRVWAMAHERSRYDFETPSWARCSTFLRGATFPGLMAVTTEGEPGAGPIAFRHPDIEDLIADPDTPEGEAALVAWADRLIPEGAPRPARLAKAPGRGMTDQSEPWISLNSDASRAALGASLGMELDRRRFRGNLWIEGLDPWAEHGWEGREIRIGQTLLRATERIGRCSATKADPATGLRDAETLDALTALGQREDFGIFALVVEGGEIALGDAVELLEPRA